MSELVQVLDGYKSNLVSLFEETRSFNTATMVWETKWQISGSFPMHIDQASSTDRQIAAQLGVGIVYIAMWLRGTPLKFDDKLGYIDQETDKPVYVKITTDPLPNRSEGFENVIQAQAQTWTPTPEVLKIELPVELPA